MLPLGCILSRQPFDGHGEGRCRGERAHAVPMMMLAPPEVGAGRPPPPPFDLPAAPAGVGPLCMAVAPSETGAESSLTLMMRCSKRTSVKNLA